MKKELLLILVFLTYGLISCEKKGNHPSVNISGKWIEVTEKNDTIIFTQFGSNRALNLRRGYDVRYGHWLLPGDMYFYFLLDSDSIALISVFSSLCPVPDPGCYPHYSFKLITSDTLEIANFYNPAIGANEKISFSKIE